MSTYKFFPRKLETMEFRGWTDIALDWVRDHARTLLIGGGVVVALVVVAFGGSVLWRSSAEKVLAEQRASFEAAEKLRLQGDHQGAAEIYQRIIQQTRREPMLRIGAQHALALSLDALGKKEEACAVYTQAGADPENIVAPWSRFAEAQCREGLGQQAEAETIYRTLTASEENIPTEIKAKSEERLK
ncbi:MAG: hypothetical protein HY465_04435 [Deltaproteobacteria bacterium]|nr:hypothetical protein [Deltaproteobacteria bacterium]